MQLCKFVWIGPKNETLLVACFYDVDTRSAGSEIWNTAVEDIYICV